MRPSLAIDSRFGTAKGNCLPGPYLPHALLRLSPDIEAPMPTHGYRPGAAFTGFSHTHVAGTGGNSRYGNLRVLPFIGRPVPAPVVEERVEVGRYAGTVAGVDCALTTTRQVGVHRYRCDQAFGLHLDLGAAIQNRRRPVAACGGSVGGFCQVVDGRWLVGRADLQGGWGHLEPYSVFIAATWDQDAQVRIGDATGLWDGTSASGVGCQAELRFPGGGTVHLRVGVSLVSVAEARRAVTQEAAADFDTLVEDHRAAWDAHLGVLEVEGGSEDDLRLLRSAQYRLACLPTDLGTTGSPLWASGDRQYWDLYCLWDSARNADSWRMLLDPALHRDLCLGLIDIADHTGWLPDAWVAGSHGQRQGGCHAITVLADAEARGLALPWERLRPHLIREREGTSPDPERLGRHAGYRERGWLPMGVRNSVSRSLEYARQDELIADLAERHGDHALAAACRADAARVWELWHPELRCFAPKGRNGAWASPLDPWAPERPDWWDDPYFYEGTAHMWALSCPDRARLVQAHGGTEAFAAHLDRLNADGLYRWKEIVVHAPWLYHAIGIPERSVQAVAQRLARSYHLAPDGLPDDEDMGCHSAWIIGALLGLFPDVGSDRWWAIPPRFTRVTLHGRTLPTGPARTLRHRDLRPC